MADLQERLRQSILRLQQQGAFVGLDTDIRETIAALDEKDAKLAAQAERIAALEEALPYLLACVEAHADKFPVPVHIRATINKIRALLESTP